MKVGKKKAWSKAASMALAATLGAFMCVPAVSAVAPQEAFAENQITINDSDDSTATYTGYQIFKGTVADTAGSGKTITGIAWSSDAMKTAVEGAIKTQDSTYSGTTAQDAADFISNHITGTNNTSVVSSNSFANALAKAVESVSDATTITVTANAQTTSAPDGGYYLFKTASKGEHNTATSPIYAVIGGSDVTVTAKKSVPTVDKTVAKNTSSGTETAAGHTDAAIGDTLTFTLTGHLPSNYATYDDYAYTFKDTASEGLTLTPGTENADIHVYVTNGGTDTEVTSGFTKTVTGQNLQVAFANLKASSGDSQVKDSSGNSVTIDANTTIKVTYTAKLNDKAAVSSTGNENNATVTYSNDPHASGTGESTPGKVKVYTYKLNLNKVDLGTEQALSGASFSIKNTTSGDVNYGKYVQVDTSGYLSGYTDNANNLSTNSSGVLNVTGLDAGTYEVEETVVPSGYSKVANFTFTITPSFSGNDLSSVSTSVTGTNVIAGTGNNTPGDNTLTATTDSGTSTDGTVTVTVGDSKNVGLPVTGMSGITWTFVVGGAVLILTIGYAVHASRKRREEQE